MKLPPEQRQAYEAYQDDLHYQASMFESTYGEGYLDGVDENIRQTVLRMHKKGLKIEMIAEIAGIAENDVKTYFEVFLK